MRWLILQAQFFGVCQSFTTQDRPDAGSGHVFTAHSLPSFEMQSAQKRNFYGESGDADSP